jgi:hypothetical protein
MNAALEQLQSEGFPLKAEDVARLSALVFDHIQPCSGGTPSPFRIRCKEESWRPLRSPPDALDDVA